VSGHQEVPGPEEPTSETAARAAEPPTEADDEVVVDLREGVDTVAVYRADAARRAAAN